MISLQNDRQNERERERREKKMYATASEPALATRQYFSQRRHSSVDGRKTEIQISTKKKQQLTNVYKKQIPKMNKQNTQT